MHVIIFPSELQCFVQGQCTGVLLEGSTVSTSELCLEACQDNDDCQWFTFDSSSSSCYLLETCPLLDEDCATCVSGHRLCSGGTEPTTGK